MNIFINISHPAHVHFFRNAINMLSTRGHHVITGARDKEFSIALLKAYGIDHLFLTRKGKGVLGLAKELIVQQPKIAKIAGRYGIDIMLQIGGIFNAPIGRVYGIPTLAFSDTENDRWGNRLSFPLSKHVLSPTCFDHAVGGSWRNQVLYPGYHELAYLSPRYVPEEINPKNNFLVRFVGWGAGHDVGEVGLSVHQKIEIIHILKRYGSVHVSSEAPLPEEVLEFELKIHPSKIHDFMKGCRMVVGESATMTSEAACLGIPAVFISNTGRGYTTEQDRRYGLVKHYRIDQWEEILRTLNEWAHRELNQEWQRKRWTMLREKIDVTPWLVDLIEGYPDSVEKARRWAFEGYYIRCAG
ncbi:MAG: DUF354 domain-containing protein [Pseudomonadota bacterium]